MSVTASSRPVAATAPPLRPWRAVLLSPTDMAQVQVGLDELQLPPHVQLAVLDRERLGRVGRVAAGLRGGAGAGA